MAPKPSTRHTVESRGRKAARALAGLLVACLLPVRGYGQGFEGVRVIDPFPVLDAAGEAYPFPFFGGFNAPRLQFLDLDADGDDDLFVQEEEGAVMLFRNLGTPQAARFTWETDAFAGLDVGAWFRFVDVDEDGDPDLFAEHPTDRVRLYRNDGPPDAPVFTLIAAPLVDTMGDPVRAERINIPAFTDIDCDGDTDFFIGDQSGTITFYRHEGLDAEGRPRFTLETPFFQNILIIAKRPPGPAGPNRVLHGANSLTFADLDADGDPDLLFGDFFSPSLYFFDNEGTCTEPVLVRTADSYPPDTPVETSGFNIPRFADLDGDGDHDLFVGVLGGALAASRGSVENFYFYENTGTRETPQFSLQTRRFIKGIDVGERSIPALTDLDGDGDLDLIIGHEVDPETGERGQLALFEQQGSPTAPVYRLVDEDYLNLAIPLGFNYAPAFADLDGDGDPDGFVGTFNGGLYFLENTGSAGVPSFAGPQPVEARVNGRVIPIDVGNNSTPAFADLDGDGDLDLVLGMNFGTLNLYRNTGSPTEPAFEWVNFDSPLDGIDVGQDSAPALADVDGDGDVDLWVGSRDEGLVLYRNMGTPAVPVFERDTAGPGFGSGVLRAPRYAAPAMGDLDGDGDPDLITGQEAGGLSYFRNESVPVRHTPGVPHSPAGPGLRAPYPNPFRGQATFEITGLGYSPGMLIVTDVLGRRVGSWVLAAGTARVIWDGTDTYGAAVGSGVYLVRLVVDGRTRGVRTVVRME